MRVASSFLRHKYLPGGQISVTFSIKRYWPPDRQATPPFLGSGLLQTRYFNVPQVVSLSFTQVLLLPYCQLDQPPGTVKGNLGSISSTFYALIFCMKVPSNPNSKKRKDAQLISFCTKMSE